MAELVYPIRSRELEIVARHHGTQFWLFVVTCLTAGIVAVRFLHLWVLHPLRAIGESLARAEPGPVLPLIAPRDELGRVAQLVQTSFAQRAEFEVMWTERVRLGRELHDGVIQTVYAAGMNLTGARAGLRRDPAVETRNGTARARRVSRRSLIPRAGTGRQKPRTPRASRVEYRAR